MNQRPIQDDGVFAPRLWARPTDPAVEPVASFPLPHYEFFLREIGRLGVEVITYDDLFADSGDWDYRAFYPEEHQQWRCRRDPGKTCLLIQHDIDNHPFFTQRMVAMEAAYGIRSNIFIFRDRYARGDKVAYHLDHDFFVAAERCGFVVGYHQNALALAGFDLERAVDRYRSDVEHLRTRYRIRYVVPHGGAGGVVDGKRVHNVDVPMPTEFRDNLRWVYNRHGVKFDRQWSDGGLRRTRDAARVRQFDLVGHFLHRLKPGTRNFCLVHPQRWGYNVDVNQNPLLAKEQWYLDLCAAAKSKKHAGRGGGLTC